VENHNFVNIGGDITKALKGEYIITPINVVREAWKMTLSSRWPINIGLLFIIVLGSVISVVASSYFGGFEVILSDPKASLILNTIVTVAIAPFIAGVEMMGVLHALGVKTDSRLIFAFLNRGSWVVLCSLLTSALTSLGLQLFVLPGIFLLVALSLTIPLVVEKKMSAFNAVSISVRALRFQWFNIFAVYMVFIVALAAIILPYVVFTHLELPVVGITLTFIGLSYLAPCFYNAKGILYREIFGMQLQTVEGENTKDHDTFIA